MRSAFDVNSISVASGVNIPANICGNIIISVQKTTEYVSDSKEFYIDYVIIGDEQEIDKFLDIRIRFPNGEDYIVLTDKSITYMTENGFYMYLDEKEVHMLSSARTDVEVYGGAMLYLSSYNKKQEDNHLPKKSRDNNIRYQSEPLKSLLIPTRSNSPIYHTAHQFPL